MYRINCITSLQNRAIVDNILGLGSFVNDAGDIEVLHYEPTTESAKAFLTWRASRHYATDSSFDLQAAISEIETGSLTINSVTATIQPL